MNKTSQLICAHSALVFAVVLGAGIFGVAGWLPTIAPSRSAADIAQMFLQDQTRIRIGMSMLAAASVLWWAMSAVIAVQMKRIEGPHHPMTYLQLASASGTVMAILFPAYIWLALVYRPGTVTPETMQLVNDFNWMVFIGAYPPACIQNFAIGICILSDKRAEPIFPRWVAYANFWIAIAFLPGVLIPFFKTGPFTWTGLIGFWLVAVTFFGWIVMMWWATVRAINRQALSPDGA
ncbi:MAG: hypothetical protein ACT4PZ_19225 [Panacagrimonas sp.]